MIKVCLDPGHGPSNRKPGINDPGATEGNLTEAEQAYRLVESGLYVAALPEFASLLSVGLTRDSRTEPAPVGGRDDEARREGATHLISVHLNAGGGHGTETFYRDARDKALASIVQSAAVAAFGLRDRGLKTESESQHSRLAVLDFAPPACLWEAGFIDHPSDMAKLFGEGSRERRIEFWGRVFRALVAPEGGK